MLLAAACREEGRQRTRGITLAAAASVAPAMIELATAYGAKHGVQVVVTQGATGTLAAQIRNGAPIDALYAADMDSVRRLADEGMIEAASVREFARGTLVLWQGRDARHRLGSLEGLAPGDLPAGFRVAVANPDTAPYGRAAVEVLRRHGWGDAELGALVRAENVGQALQFARTGNVDASFVALSNLKPDDPPGIEIPGDQHMPIIQGCGVVAHSAAKAEAEAFDAWVASPEGEAILARHRLK